MRHPCDLEFRSKTIKLSKYFKWKQLQQEQEKSPKFGHHLGIMEHYLRFGSTTPNPLPWNFSHPCFRPEFRNTLSSDHPSNETPEFLTKFTEHTVPICGIQCIMSNVFHCYELEMNTVLYSMLFCLRCCLLFLRPCLSDDAELENDSEAGFTQSGNKASS